MHLKRTVITSKKSLTASKNSDLKNNSNFKCYKMPNAKFVDQLDGITFNCSLSLLKKRIEIEVKHFISDLQIFDRVVLRHYFVCVWFSAIKARLFLTIGVRKSICYSTMTI